MLIKIKIYIVLISLISSYLITLICINLFKREYSDSPYNYLTKNWLNYPIKDIKILETPETTNIKEFDNQNNLGFFKSGSKEQDLNIFMGKFFKIETYSPYYYPNFAGFSHKKENNKICGKDSQGNILYFPKNEECPINFIALSTSNNFFDSLNINCKYQLLKDNNYLVTSTENINGEILTQLRINYNNDICADSSIDLTFNELLNDYEKKECDEDSGYDLIYHKIGEESVKDFLNENNINNINIKKDDNIFLSYRGYLAVDSIEKFDEDPIDHVTYAKTVALSKNIILFISWAYYIFTSLFVLYFIIKNKYHLSVIIVLIIYLVIFIFNFSYDFLTIFNFVRVREIVSTVNLEGLKEYKTGIRWFIVIDIFILSGIVFDLALKILQFLDFRKNYKKPNDENDSKVIKINNAKE